MSYTNFAMQEFQAAGWLDEHGNFKDGMQEAICKDVLALLDVFSTQGHSGFSGSYALGLFQKLANFKPIGPVTGEDWEWNQVGDGVFQNKRCSHIFKDVDRFDGKPYDIEAVVFYDWYVDPETGERSKSYFTSYESARVIEFPYTPTTVYEERLE